MVTRAEIRAKAPLRRGLRTSSPPLRKRLRTMPDPDPTSYWDLPDPGDARPTARPQPWLDAVFVSASAVAGLLLGALLHSLLTGAIGLAGPLLGHIAGTTGLLALQVKRRPGWLTRDHLRRLSVRAGVLEAAAVGLGWGACANTWPERFMASESVGLAAVATGLLVGGTGLVVTLCAGDGVAMVWSPFPEERTGQAHGPWRRR